MRKKELCSFKLQQRKKKMSKKINRILNIDEAFEDEKNYVINYSWNDRLSRDNSRIFNGCKLKEEIKKLSFMSPFKVGEIDKYGDIGQFNCYNKRDNDVIVLNEKSTQYMTFDIDETCFQFFKIYRTNNSLIEMLKSLIEIKDTKDYIGFKDISYYCIEGCKLINMFPTKKEWFKHVFDDFDRLNDFLNDHKDIFNEDCFKAIENLKERINKVYNSFE